VLQTTRMIKPIILKSEDIGFGDVSANLDFAGEVI
jgi:hypothetical protein